MHNPYEKEAKEKWGHTESYAISQKRVQSYTPEDWEQIHAEAHAIYHRFLEISGQDYAQPSVYNLVQDWQNHLSKYYYPCSIEQLEQLGAMYVADQRFVDTLDQVGMGLAQVMSDAIEDFCVFQLLKTKNI